MSIDASAKQAIGTALQAQVRSDLAAHRERFAHEHRAASVDQEGSFAVDDLSQSDEAGDLAGFAGDAVAQSESMLAAVDALDLSPTEVVRAGAVVAFGGDRYLVGVAAAPFTVDGVRYEGISADSPVFAAIQGKRAGDRFVVGGGEHVLDEVG